MNQQNSNLQRTYGRNWTQQSFPELSQKTKSLDKERTLLMTCVPTAKEGYSKENLQPVKTGRTLTKITIKASKNLIEPERIMKTVMIRIARTNQRLLPGWIDSKLQLNALTRAWAATYSTVGKEHQLGQRLSPQQ
jgi:hypothetical protein